MVSIQSLRRLVNSQHFLLHRYYIISHTRVTQILHHESYTRYTDILVTPGPCLPGDTWQLFRAGVIRLLAGGRVYGWSAPPSKLQTLYTRILTDTLVRQPLSTRNATLSEWSSKSLRSSLTQQAMSGSERQRAAVSGSEWQMVTVSGSW